MNTGPDDPFRFEAAKSLEDSLRELVEGWRAVWGTDVSRFGYAAGVSDAFNACARQVEDLLK